MNQKCGIVHLLSDARGIYIPRDFVQNFAIECKEEDREEAKNGKVWHGITAENVVDCQDPYNEWYWEAWESILNNAYWIDTNGFRWCLYQDGDLWAICYELLTDEEKENFGFDN